MHTGGSVDVGFAHIHLIFGVAIAHAVFIEPAVVFVDGFHGIPSAGGGIGVVASGAEHGLSEDGGFVGAHIFDGEAAIVVASATVQEEFVSGDGEVGTAHAAIASGSSGGGRACHIGAFIFFIVEVVAIVAHLVDEVLRSIDGVDDTCCGGSDAQFARSDYFFHCTFRDSHGIHHGLLVGEEIHIAARFAHHIAAGGDKVGLPGFIEGKGDFGAVGSIAVSVNNQLIGCRGDAVGTLNQVAGIVEANAMAIGAFIVEFVRNFAVFVIGDEFAGGVVVHVEHAIFHGSHLCAIAFGFGGYA